MIHSNETQEDLMQATESGAEINKKNWCQFRVRMIWDDKKLGRGYNSTIGHTAVIGLSTGKVLEYITKNKHFATVLLRNKQEKHQNSTTAEKPIQVYPRLWSLLPL